jgi:hypothetical protein
MPASPAIAPLRNTLLPRWIWPCMRKSDAFLRVIVAWKMGKSQQGGHFPCVGGGITTMAAGGFECCRADFPIAFRCCCAARDFRAKVRQVVFVEMRDVDAPTLPFTVFSPLRQTGFPRHLSSIPRCFVHSFQVWRFSSALVSCRHSRGMPSTGT